MRDVVLRASGELDRCAHPDAARYGGVLLARRMGERQLYLQVRLNGCTGPRIACPRVTLPCFGSSLRS